MYEFSSYEKRKYHNYKHIFTDGSKDPKSGNTGSAVVIPSQGFEICKQTSNNLNIHTVELYAILIEVCKPDTLSTFGPGSGLFF